MSTNNTSGAQASNLQSNTQVPDKQPPKDSSPTNTEVDTTKNSKKTWYAWIFGSIAVVGAVTAFAFLLRARKHHHN